MKHGIYIHIPYCTKKCPYCDFYSTVYNQSSAEKYAEAVITAVKSYKNKDICADTVYFGGGTPNLIGAEQICRIMEAISQSFRLSSDAEITLEANPETLKMQDISAFKKAGINRLSMGLQSANLHELKALGRRHAPKDVIFCVNEAVRSGIDNISLDLMLALEGQDKTSLLNSIDFCAELCVSHISAYILKIEPRTLFYKNRDLLNLPGDDEASELYLFAAEELEKRGYMQYEISNFARDNKFSRHNLKYWQGSEYIGIGASAHGFENGERYYYERSINDFISSPLSRVSDGKGGGAEEFFMLNMRLKSGVDLKEFEKKFDLSIPNSFYLKLEQFIRASLAEKIGERVILTLNGFLLSNSIISELLFCLGL